MSRKRISLILAALATTGVAVVGASSAAQATTAASKPAPQRVAAAADGYFYAWIDSNFSGGSCRWAGNASNWGSCRNQASSVQNNGYAGAYDDVNMYWGVDYTGAWYCLPPGHYLRDMQYDYFNRGGSGLGQAMGDNVSSHKWTTSC
jgi:hypothetical protein